MQMSRDFFSPFKLRSAIFHSKCYVVHRTRARMSIMRIRIDKQVDVIAERSALGGESNPAVFFSNFVEAQNVKDCSGRFRTVLKERDSEEAADGIFRRNRSKAGSVHRSGMGMSDELDLHPIRVEKRKHLLFEFSAGPLHQHLVSQ